MNVTIRILHAFSLFVLAPLSAVLAAPKAGSLEAAGARVRAAISAGDFHQFLACCRSGEILVTSRFKDWNANAGEVSKRTLLEIPGEKGVWTEATASFEAGEADQADFQRAFTRFCHTTEGTYWGQTSRDTWDAWQERRLGPVLEGKVASNVHWYVYFVRQAGRWKVWKIEVAQH